MGSNSKNNRKGIGEISMIKVCIIGAGNISNTRHIPALKKLKNVEIIGVISDVQEKIDKTCSEHNIKNGLLVADPKNDKEKVQKCDWFKDVDAVVIGTPPRQHYPLVKLALELDKDVLVEKPMTMNVEEADELIALAKKKKRIFNVVHNFQYTSGMVKLNKIIEDKKYGEIQTITEVQFSNKSRRLPSWYQDLPLGLFYDEAAHFTYLLYNHGGKVKVLDSTATYTNDDGNTPDVLSVNAVAGKIPVHMFLNFNSPVCEWYYIVNFEKRIVLYDLFKDILIDLPTDNEHYAADILKNDLSRSWQYWFGFIKNGFKMVRGNLLYGHETVLKNYIEAVETRKEDPNLSAKEGRETVKTMIEICEKARKEKC